MYNGLALLKEFSLYDRGNGMRRTSGTIDHHTGEKTTDKTQLKRAPIFVGILLLLYTVAAGLWMHYSGETVAPEAIRQHAIVGIIGSATCIVALIASVWQHRE